jgi:hypothetical protein
MFFTYRMKSTPQGVFNITNNRVYPFEFRQFNAFGATTGDYGNMLMAALFKSGEAFKTIGHHISLWSQMLLSPVFDRFLGKPAYLTEPNSEWTTLFTYGYRCDKGNFPGSSSSSSAVALFTAPIGVVNLDIFSIQRFAIITLFHNLLYFMLDQESRVV